MKAFIETKEEAYLNRIKEEKEMKLKEMKEKRALAKKYISDTKKMLDEQCINNE